MLTCMKFIQVFCSPSANSLALGSKKRTFWKSFGLPYWQRSWYQHQRQWRGKNTCHYKLVLLIRVASFPGSGENAISAFWKSVCQPSNFVAVFLNSATAGLEGDKYIAKPTIRNIGNYILPPICYITVWYQSIPNSCPVVHWTLLQFLYQLTPLHIAVEELRVMTAKFLVNKGANVNSKDNDGVSNYCIVGNLGKVFNLANWRICGKLALKLAII